MLELQNLSRSYRGIPASKKLNFRVEAGEIIGIGANGSGKFHHRKNITGF